MMHGFVEVDVTSHREQIRQYTARTGERLSFTAFIAACLGQAVDEDRMVHAYRDWRHRLVYPLGERNPRWMKRTSGTVGLTSVGMFGTRSGWGLGMPVHSLAVMVGGIAQKPGVVDSRIEVREYLDLTLSFDHNIVDGAPAARFAQKFADLIESGWGLEQVNR
jgi:hypothetical protein